jgi:hypothetical protein
MVRVNWVKLVEPTPEERARIGAGVFSECKRCGGRDGFPLPADVLEVAVGLGAILEAHRACEVL